MELDQKYPELYDQCGSKTLGNIAIGSKLAGIGKNTCSVILGHSLIHFVDCIQNYIHGKPNNLFMRACAKNTIAEKVGRLAKEEITSFFCSA